MLSRRPSRLSPHGRKHQPASLPPSREALLYPCLFQDMLLPRKQAECKAYMASSEITGRQIQKCPFAGVSTLMTEAIARHHPPAKCHPCGSEDQYSAVEREGTRPCMWHLVLHRNARVYWVPAFAGMTPVPVGQALNLSRSWTCFGLPLSLVPGGHEVVFRAHLHQP
jgi:hypothetical protein